MADFVKSLFVKGVEIDTTGAIVGDVLKYNGTKFGAASAGSTGSSLVTQDSPPASPTAGMLWYESDTGRTFIYYDSAWVEVGNATDIAGAIQPGQVTALSAVTSLTTDDVFVVVDNPSSATAANKITYGNLSTAISNTLAPGLVLVKTQAVGTTVSSVEVTSAFSSTYDNYLITLNGGTASGDTAIGIQLGASTTGYYGFLNYGAPGSSTPLGATINNASRGSFVGGATSGQQAHVRVEVLGPNLAAYTKIIGGAYANGGNYGTSNTEHRVATAYTAFTLLTDSPTTLTGGTIRVYGYRNS